MTILDLDALGSVRVAVEANPWASYTGATTACDRLIDTFPDLGFEWFTQRRMLEALGKVGTDSWYRHGVQTRPLLELGCSHPSMEQDLSEEWMALADEISSKPYRESLGECAGVNLASLQSQTHFWKYHPGSSFQPHIDKPHKIVTHLIYLNQDWTPDHGGALQLLNSADPGDTRELIEPDANRAVVLRRTDQAWHAVTPIPRACNRIRLVLQTWFWA